METHCMDALDLTLGWLTLLSLAFWLAALVVLSQTFSVNLSTNSPRPWRAHGLLLGLAAWCLAPGAPRLDSIVLRPEAAVIITLGSLGTAWLAYRALCDALYRRPLLLSGVLFGLLAYAVWGYHQLFDGSGAYLLTQALLVTLMACNLVTPNSNPARVALGLQHNRYLTPPLLFALLCSHSPALLDNPYAWQLLLLIGGMLALIWYGLEHAMAPKWALSSALAVLAIYIAMPEGLQREASAKPVLPTVTAAVQPSLPPLSSHAPTGLDPRREFALVQRIIQDRCVECHSRTPSNPIFQATPLVPTLDTPEQILAWKRAIHEQAVASQNMPLANLTQMSQAERDLLGLWIEKGK